MPFASLRFFFLKEHRFLERMRWSGPRLCGLQMRRATGDLTAQLQKANEQHAAAISAKGAPTDATPSMAPAFTSLDVFPELRLVSLPATRGSHAAAVRAELAKEDAIAAIRSFIVPTAGKTVVVMGDAGLPYLKRLLVLEALDVGQLIVVGRSLGTLARTSHDLGPALRGKACCIRSDEPFVLQHVLGEETCDVIVLPTPRPYPGPSNSYRLLTRDVFTLAHQCLRTRTGPSAAMGLITWTPSPSYFAFAVAQLEESKLVVPWARKDPAVFAAWQPQEQRRETMLSLCIAKSDRTSPLAKQLNTQYSYARRKYAPF